MDYLDKAEKEIREHWFKDHVADIRGEEGLQVIYWGKPNTSSYATKYVLSGNNVFISGDIGEAVYSLTCKATLENIEDFNLGYFTGKLTAYCGAREEFDEKKARQELREHWKQYDMKDVDDSNELYQAIRSAIRESSTIDQYNFQLSLVYHDSTLEYDAFEGLFSIGKQMPYRLIGYWVGLKMIIEQVAAKKEG